HCKQRPILAENHVPVVRILAQLLYADVRHLKPKQAWRMQFTVAEPWLYGSETILQKRDRAERRGVDDLIGCHGLRGSILPSRIRSSGQAALHARRGRRW